MSEKLKGCQFFAQTLKAYGITHVFYMEAIMRNSLRELRKEGITCVMTHSEGAAGYMADGYARAAGRPGLCMAQSIGAGNMAGGVYDAWLANSPVIAITGRKEAQYQYKNCYQETDHRLLYEGITKFNVQVDSPGQFPFLLRQSFREVTTGKPRPAHIDTLDRVGSVVDLAEMDEPVICEENYGRYPAFRPAAAEASVQKAAAEINRAERPILVAGRGAAISGAADEIAALAEKGDIPVATTPDGKCMIDENGSYWVGICGDYGMVCANTAISEADLVVFIGTQTADQTTYDWKIPAASTKVIHIDICPAELGKNYPHTTGLWGDAKTVVAQLIGAVKTQKRPEWRARTAALVQNAEEEYRDNCMKEQEMIRPDRLCKELNAALPADAIVVSDTGYSAVWSATKLRMRPSQKYIRAAGSLGWAFPAAMGVKCAAPDRPVLCFTGDGAMLYHLGEIETAVKYGIKTVTIINNNGALVQCLPPTRIANPQAEDKGESLISFFPINFSEIAGAMGCYAKRIKKAEEIRPAVEKALLMDGPVILEVMTDKQILVPPAMDK